MYSFSVSCSRSSLNKVRKYCFSPPRLVGKRKQLTPIRPERYPFYEPFRRAEPRDDREHRRRSIWQSRVSSLTRPPEELPCDREGFQEAVRFPLRRSSMHLPEFSAGREPENRLKIAARDGC